MKTTFLIIILLLVQHVFSQTWEHKKDSIEIRGYEYDSAGFVKMKKATWLRRECDVYCDDGRNDGGEVYPSYPTPCERQQRNSKNYIDGRLVDPKKVILIIN